MKSYKFLFTLLIFTVSFYESFSQFNTIKGVVLDEKQAPIQNVKVKVGSKFTYSGFKGNFKLILKNNTEEKITFTKKGFINKIEDLNGFTDNKSTVNLTLIKEINKTLDTIKIKTINKNSNPFLGVKISKETLLKNPSLNGIEDLLKTLPGVNSNNELSSKISVRGGSFDENLVYIDNFEIIFPNLIRSGQQEGLSLINSSLVDNIFFSAGGFEANFGDKISSVLSVNYRNPLKNEFNIEASLLGLQTSGGYVSKNKKLTYLGGVRFNDRTLILNTFSKDTEFNPIYIDYQSKIQYNLNSKWNFSLITSLSDNKISIKPQTKEINFGTTLNPVTLKIFYFGKEKDRFKNYFNAINISHKPNSKFKIDLGFFYSHLDEIESFDIESLYVFNSKAGNSLNLDIGSQLDYARNDLITNVFGFQQNFELKLQEKEAIKWGIKLQRENFQDRLNEFQLTTENGFSYINTILNLTPENSNSILNYSINSSSIISSNRFSGFGLYQNQINLNSGYLNYSAGIRGTFWSVNNEFNLSPRIQLAFKPKYNKRLEYRFTSGLYYQPAFYREMRDLNGNLNKNIKSQKSIHFILGNDYSFNLNNKNFNLTTEVYYKNLDDLIPFYLDNLRTRYTAKNNSSGCSYGIDSRISTEISNGLESWLSVSYARTLENIDGRGNLSRPTDQRFRASLFYQDYIPNFPSFKTAVNLVYASGTPKGTPLFSDPYAYRGFLPDYKRVDISFSKVFKDKNNTSTIKFIKNFSEFTVGLDIFNLFDIRNTISNQSIRDLSSNVIYQVPFSLTGRFFNLKVVAKL
ncbi:MAG: TonB-dependent receptor plug domain-containing protein [Solirubrobacteraceae bacterium]